MTYSDAMSALSFSTLLVKCLMNRLGRSTQGHAVGTILCGCLFESQLTTRCGSLLEDARDILSV